MSEEQRVGEAGWELRVLRQINAAERKVERARLQRRAVGRAARAARKRNRKAKS